MKSMRRNFSIFFKFVVITPFCVATSFAQSGGTYQITQTSIAGGGQTTSSGGNYSLGTTIGQAPAGTTSDGPGGRFALQLGFWTPAALAPTAANVAISGRVTRSDGAGIVKVTLTLTDSLGVSRTTRTGASGVYRFDNVEAGQSYLLTVTSQRYVFNHASRIVVVNDFLQDIDFVSEPGPNR